jgi:hypothetical protein
MKRVISAFLLLIMALASVHTTWAWHYCGGILHSVTLADGNPACCCGKKSDCSPLENSDSQITESCCSEYIIDISTDNFNCPQDLAQGTNQLVPNPALFSNLLKLNDSEDISVSQYIFPPGGFAKDNADLLTLICIFRI